MASPEANLTRRGRALLLLVLFALGLACLALPEAAESGVATEWVRRYSGPANGPDYPQAIMVDGQGNIYVSGNSDGFYFNFDYLTIKCNSKGQRLWARRYPRKSGPGHGGWMAGVKSMAMDIEGNVYVTGEMMLDFTGSGGFDYATVKYSPDGKRLWVRSYNGPGNGDDSSKAITVDSQGNVYVSGSSWSGTSIDYLTIKYSTDGRRLWVRRHNRPGNYKSEGRAIAIDGQGNVCVLGLSWNTANNDDILTTIKYSPEGRQLWVASFPGVTGGRDTAKALAVDPEGNIYVCGGFQGHFLTIKYSPEGQQLWSRIDKMAISYNAPQALALDFQGNVVAAGGRNTIKYSPEGQLLWFKDCGFSLRAMALDASGDIYVTGDGFRTIKYNSGGEEMWVHQYQYSAHAIALDGQGNVYVTGDNWYNVSWPNADYITIKLLQSPRTGR